MKAQRVVEPEQCFFGSATESLRRILEVWYEIDWFVPCTRSDAPSVATKQLLHFQRFVRFYCPDRATDLLHIETQSGDWNAFASLYQRTRVQPWDWKFSVLKTMSAAHANAFKWSILQYARETSGPAYGTTPLFSWFNDRVFWNPLGQPLLGEELLPLYREAGGWYASYAHMDLVDALQWQLAESSAQLEENPFYALLECYRAGMYPFSTGIDTMLLFAFRDV